MNNLPAEYVDVIKKLERFLHDNYQNRLKIFTLTGSAAYGCILNNISDLDFLILLDEAHPDDYRNIFRFKKTLNKKVDMIIISERQVQHLYLDYNSIYYLYMLKIGHFKPIYIDPTYQINISKKAVLSYIKNILSLNIRTLKRMVYDEESKDSYLITKYVSYVVKNYLILCGIFAENILVTFNEFYKISNIKFTLDIEKSLSHDLTESDFKELIFYIDSVINFMDTITTEELMLDENGVLFESIPKE